MRPPPQAQNLPIVAIIQKLLDNRPRIRSMTNEETLREHLVKLLNWDCAHESFDMIADFPERVRGTRPEGMPYTAWQLLEHMRICQWDIHKFCRNPDHVSPKFPDGYWPESGAPPDREAWDNSVNSFRSDLKAMQDLIADPSTDLFRPISHGDGQTILREALLLADHNAYHLGQLMAVRRLLGAWPDNTTGK